MRQNTVGIAENAFGACSNITSISLPASVKTIGLGAFYDCENLEVMVIPEGVVGINPWTFQNCIKLTGISIPASVKFIQLEALSGCTSLTRIKFTGTVAEWQAITFSSSWNSNTGNYTINCTDGTIAKDGTVTYN